jgi:hypothetical protein
MDEISFSSLSDIGSYGDSRPGHLVLQSIITTIPQTFIYPYCQTASSLPNIQPLKRIIPHPHPLYLILKTYIIVSENKIEERKRFFLSSIRII